jgi:glycosyltransferase involved in cell wall biosynthesis
VAPAVSHSFVVLAYGESPYLDECLASLSSQEHPVPVVVSTSTPHPGLDRTCTAHGATLRVHGPNRGIGHDWNVGYASATTDWVTLAHQDDVYNPEYTSFVRDSAAAHPGDRMVFSTYYEIANGQRRPTVSMLRIKRILLELGFLGATRVNSRARKRRVLRFGNPVSCPTVALNKRALGDFRFRDDMKTNMDWLAWLDIADEPGGIGLSRRPLVGHRIHARSETSTTISEGDRYREDLEIFERLWPAPIARLIASVYARSYRSNELPTS